MELKPHMHLSKSTYTNMPKASSLTKTKFSQRGFDI